MNKVAKSLRATSPSPMLIEASAPTVNLFNKAEDAINRADWKLAIDSLQRVIDDPAAGMMPVDAANPPIGYEAAQYAAMRRLAGMPPEGLAAYRLLYDGAARRELDRARAEHDLARLRNVVRRFALTSNGDQALDLLAAWSLDAGNPSEAVRALRALSDAVPDPDVPQAEVVGKLAVALAMLDRTAEAETAIKRFRSAHGGLSTGAAAPDWLARIDLSAFQSLETRGLVASSASPNEWVVSGGNLARDCRMPATSPIIAEHLPWRVALTDGPAEPAPNLWTTFSMDRPRWPDGSPVIHGESIFVRTKQGIAAHDVADLRRRWSVDYREDAVLSRNEEDDPDETERWGVLSGLIAGSMLASDSTLYAIEPDEAEWNRLRNPRQLRRNVWRSMRGESVLSTQLTAYATDTGARRWTLGSQAPDLDGAVAFRGSPLLIDGRLWLPMMRETDLYITIIDPQTAEVRRQLLLGSVDRATWIDRSIATAYSDGLLYVAAGAGVVFAVDVFAEQPAWACRYAQILERQSQWSAPQLLVAGGFVIVAPPDANELVALDSATGQRSWSVFLDGANYVIAADHERIWVGGLRLYSLLTRDGSAAWSALPTGAPTGRAALAGPRILAPTSDGLVRINALNGTIEQVDKLPSSQPALGNLVCAAGSMFSVDSKWLRRFPDVEQSYGPARSQQEANPTDPVAALRRAWLEILRDAPDDADAVLRELPAERLGSDPELRDEVIQARVEALLRIAAASGQSNQSAVERLRDAERIARSPDDRMRCALALAERLAQSGAAKDAFELVWRLGVESASDIVVPQLDQIRRPVRFELAERLANVQARLTPADLDAVKQGINQQLAAAEQQMRNPDTRRAGRALLRRVADLDRHGPFGSKALGLLATRLLSLQQHEQAERVLWERTELATGSDAVAALVQLCDLYSDANWWPSTRFMASALDVLAAKHGTEEVPGDGTNRRVADWAASRRGSLYSGGTDDRPGAGEAFVLSGDGLWRLDSQQLDVPAFVDFPSEADPAMEDLVIYAAFDHAVTCTRATTGDIVWETSLLPADVPRPTINQQQVYTRERPLRGVVDGSVAVFEGIHALVGVGLSTGRRLWIQPHDDGGGFTPSALRVDAGQHPEMDLDGFDFADGATTAYRPLAAAGGRVSALRGVSRIRTFRTSDGGLLWERELPGEYVAQLSVQDGCLIAVNPRFDRIHVFDHEDGRLLRRILVKQLHEASPVAPVATAGIIVSADRIEGTDGIAGFALRADGAEPAWRVSLSKPVAHLFVPGDGYVGVGLVGGEVRILRAATGEVVIEHDLATTGAAEGGVLAGGTLLLEHIDIRRGRPAPVLTAIDVANRKVLWRREDLAAANSIRVPLGVYDHMVPVIVEDSAVNGQEVKGGIRMPSLVLTVLDAETGTALGPAVELGVPNYHMNFAARVRVLPGAIIVGFPRSIQAYSTTPVSGRDSGGA